MFSAIVYVDAPAVVVRVAISRPALDNGDSTVMVNVSSEAMIPY